jgi:hypothetical protein
MAVDILDWLLFLPALLVVVYGCYYILKCYLAITGQVEDHYLLIMVFSILLFLCMELYIITSNIINIELVVTGQMFLIWGYWGLVMYLYHRLVFRSFRFRRVMSVLLDLFIAVFTALLIGLDPPRFINMNIINTNYGSLLRLDYALDLTFFSVLQIYKLGLLGLGVILAWVRTYQPSWMFYALSFAFTAELLTLINAHLYTDNPSLFIFRVVHICVAIACVTATMGIKRFLNKRGSACL